MPQIVAEQIAKILVKDCTTDSQVHEALCAGIRLARIAGYEDDLLVSEVVGCLERELATTSGRLTSAFLSRCIALIRQTDCGKSDELDREDELAEPPLT